MGFSNRKLERIKPSLWNSFKHRDSPMGEARNRNESKKQLAASGPLEVREDMVEAPTVPVAPSSDYNPHGEFIESEPHTWEKVIQEGVASPADEFGRKMFHLDSKKPDINTNLYVQIIVDALEEAAAEDIVVIDCTQKHMFFPDTYEWYWMEGRVQRRIDVVVMASGKSIQHIETVLAAVLDKGKKGLIPVESSSVGKDLNPVKEEIFWHVKIPCGKIMIEIGHPYKREYKMTERHLICKTTEHSGRMMEDMLLDQGWVRVWDYWTPNAPCVSRSDFEGVYAQERCHGWERLDVLKPEYVVTDADIDRRRATQPSEPGVSAEDLTEPLTDEARSKLREFLKERAQMFNEPAHRPMGANIATEGVSDNVTFTDSPPPEVTEEDIDNYAAKLRKRFSTENIHIESPETKERKDKEWYEYEAYVKRKGGGGGSFKFLVCCCVAICQNDKNTLCPISNFSPISLGCTRQNVENNKITQNTPNHNSRRDARLRKYGYYDYVELSNDYHRGVCSNTQPMFFLSHKCFLCTGSTPKNHCANL